MKTIAIINQKGGVGKTTTVANLGAAVAARSHDLCLIDLDPQSHLTLHFGVDPSYDTPTSYDVLTGEARLSDASQMITPSLSLVPSTIDLAAAESDLAGRPGREQRLRNALRDHNLPPRFVLIDCPPSLGLLTLNALVAADEVIIPLQPHFLALQGLGRLLETIDLVAQRVNPDLKVAGVVLCMFESVTKLTGEVVSDLEEFFRASRGQGKPWSQARIFRTAVRRNIKLAECPSHGVSIFDYEPRCHGAIDYAQLAEEFLAMYADESPSDDSPFANGSTPPRSGSVPPPFPYSAESRPGSPPE